MTLQRGDEAPNFTAETLDGPVFPTGWTTVEPHLRLVPQPT
jgi:hypothetical protein